MHETQTNLIQLQQELKTLEIQQLLVEYYDQKSAYLTITAGVGGIDVEDWAAILLRMYYCWANSHNYRVRKLTESLGDWAGIKSATLEITGLYAYGCLKSEQGNHIKIVRSSPQNGIGKRLTCFANVEVSPILDKSFELKIPDKDLEITKWRWHGGNVNRPETWVQAFHIPTGITVLCDQEISQMQNQEQALAILQSKLWAFMQVQGIQNISDLQSGRIKSLFKKPIREYILHPYTRVKDLRTQVETTDATEVLNGDIDFLIKAYLQQQYQTLARANMHTE
ncbi:peptide chain release factor 2 [Nostoc carneum NIES-2107]|nr:peptide chain release factor 2 [Nostoc carneum NIES-2107]